MTKRSFLAMTMNDMAKAMHSGQLSAEHMRTMQDMMSQMQSRLSAIGK